MAEIELIYHGVYLLSTLKRRQMVREEQLEEYNRTRNASHRPQASILNDVSGSPHDLRKVPKGHVSRQSIAVHLTDGRVNDYGKCI